MGATLDREAVWTPGREQWYAAPGVRIYRHTFVGVDADGLLRPLEDAAGLEYVGVAGQAVFAGGGGRCPVLQRGEGRFRYHGTALQEHVGLIAWAVDDETISTDRDDTEQGYAVGRVASLEPDGLVRVNITGFATTAISLFLGAWRAKFSLDPHEVTAPATGANYRIGVTLPAEFSELTYAGELLCDVVGVIVNRATGQKRADYCEWNLYIPGDAGGGSYGDPVDLVLTAHFAGEGWTLGAGPFVGTWDDLSEIL